MSPELVLQNAGGLGTGVEAVFGANRQWLATSGEQGDVLVYDLAGGRVSHRFDSALRESLIAAHPKEDLLALLSRRGEDSTLQLYNVTTGQVAWKVPVDSSCGALHFSEDGSRVLGVCSAEERMRKSLLAEGSLRAWETSTGTELQMPTFAEGYIAGNIFSEGGRWVVASKPIPDSTYRKGKPARNPFTAIKQYRQFTTAMQDRAGENRFVVYAFNRDNIKTLDAKTTVKCTATASPRAAYILAIGVNRYSNEDFNLNFAVPDATHFSDVLGQTLRGVDKGEQIVQVNLLDENATKDNVDRAIHILNGQAAAEAPPSLLSELRSARPEDTVVLYFAGHGLASRDHFYLIPHDLGYAGPRSKLAGAVKDVLSHGISDIELENWLDELDAANIVLVIDACGSGKVLDAEEARRGPMNNRGLAQLAYEKGMYVLTASQAYQAALETSRLGHGYLTYALTDEGLQTMRADTAPIDGKVSVVEWFEYAARRVPEMQNEALIGPPTPDGRRLDFETELDSKDRSTASSPDASRLQTPRLYYRRELGNTLIVKTAQAP